MNKVLNFLAIIFLILLGYSYHHKDKVPKVSGIAGFEKDPYQKMIKETPYNFEYRGHEYIVKPIAEYEFSGLVVSHNNIHAFSDIYHDSDSVDIKDLCIIWGQNLNDKMISGMEFWSEPWTCFIQAKTEEAMSLFRGDQLSNNHLLSESAYLRRVISKAKIGDLVRIRGRLIGYFPKGYSELERKSSTVRDDTGDGACEVIMVDSFDIVKSLNKGINFLYSFSYYAVIILAVLRFSIFLYSCYSQTSYEHLT